jgi:hypothetical protein
MTTTQVQIMNLRRQLAGLSLAQLALRAQQPYIRLWKALGGNGPLSPEQAAAIDAALDVAEQETEDARRALAVLRSGFSAEVQ